MCQKTGTLAFYHHSFVKKVANISHLPQYPRKKLRWTPSTVPLMTVGTLPVTGAYSVSLISPFVTGYRVHTSDESWWSLISNLTRTLAYPTNHLYFLGNLSAASFLARNGGAFAPRPGLVAQKGEPPRTPSIKATDTWNGRVGEVKYKRRNANDNK